MIRAGDTNRDTSIINAVENVSTSLFFFFVVAELNSFFGDVFHIFNIWII